MEDHEKHDVEFGGEEQGHDQLDAEEEAIRDMGVGIIDVGRLNWGEQQELDKHGKRDEDRREW